MTTAAVDTMAPLAHDQRVRMRAAAFRAKRVYPGVVGEVLAGELEAFEEFGFRLAGWGTIMRLTDHILRSEVVAGTHPLP